MMRTKLLLSLSAIAVAATSAPAFAQESTDEARLDEIIVTAQRREENLQDVPVSVATLGVKPWPPSAAPVPTSAPSRAASPA